MRRYLKLICFLISTLLAATPALAQYPTYSVVQSFDQAPPLPLTLASDGNFYGYEPLYGSGNPPGYIFRMTPAGVISTVYTFDGPYLPAVGQLTEAGDGNLYGVTTGSTGGGGSNQSGSIFSLSLSGKFTTVYTFPYNETYGPEGPTSTLTLGADGKLYSMSAAAGANNCGFIFSYEISTSTMTDLHDFVCDTEGGAPTGAPLLQGADGNFYGTNAYGGPNGGSNGETGTFFQYVPGTGKLNVLFTGFNILGSDGDFPTGNLIQATNGLMYGVTSAGNGTLSYGTLYSMSTKGNFDVVFPFSDTSGGQPYQGVYQATDGNLYGTVATGGTGGETQAAGAIYQFTLAGKEDTFYSFPQDSTTGASLPKSNLIQGADGNLYGTASGPSGENPINSGVIFKLTFSPAIPAPIVLTPSAFTVAPGSPFTLNWSAANAYSVTAQQCYAFIQGSPAGAGMWTGKQAGTYSTASNKYSGSASVTPTAAGTYTYALTCGGTESGFANVTVSGASKSSTTTALTGPPAPPSVGQTATLNATVAGSGQTPTGSVTYSVESTAFGSAELNEKGEASFSASTNTIAPGTYPVIATYNGNSSYNPSASSAVNVTVVKAPTSTILAASPTSVTPPAKVTLTATVKRSAAGATGLPAGSVTFYADGTTALATVELNKDGVASLTASSAGQAPAGYSITAKYLGDASDTTSTSSSVTVTVK
jgi:uncharacterized repeat protein (TIGR03803 family)